MKKATNSVQNFFQERVSELHNITWPTQKKAIHAMILVLSIMLIVGLFLGFVDYLINQGVLWALNA